MSNNGMMKPVFEAEREYIATMSKLIAVMSGGDWCDASVNFLVLPDGMDLEQQKILYSKYLEHRRKIFMEENESLPYWSLAEWFERGGAITPEDDIIEEVWDE